MSGETASFLAGGGVPDPGRAVPFGTIAIEYKEFGVGLAFTPMTLHDGRISMRVRPEVSELSDNGAVELNGYVIPALSTRRAETTVELGSGQSFMIAGLLRNTSTNDINKAPFLGDIPILQHVFRSTKFRHEDRLRHRRHAVSGVRRRASFRCRPTATARPTTSAQFGGQIYSGKSGSTVPTAIQGGPVTAPAAPSAAPGFRL